MPKRSQEKVLPIQQVAQPSEQVVTKKLFSDLRSLIDSARNQVAKSVNLGLVMLNWHIGKRIREDILGQERAEYGKKIIATVSQQLTHEYGKGFSREALSRMVQFTDKYSNFQTFVRYTINISEASFISLPIAKPWGHLRSASV
jgi:hypothetical protein